MRRHAVCVFLALAVCGCGQRAAAAPPAAVPPVVMPALPAADTLDVAGAYDVIGAGLADDRASGLAPYAQRLVTLAGPDKPALAAGAAALAATLQSPDIEKQRLAFGEVSKTLVALIALEPARQKGLFLFECPMAKGYQRWIQSSEKLQNPYMGKKMLGCGSRVDKWAI
jgi:membrane fusion protein, copper/silver efflux system